MGIDILLVDDEKEFAQTLAERLELRGFTVHIANSGEQALRMSDECPARIMLLDLKMPGMDGLEVLRRIKKKDPGFQVIILSGHGSEMDDAYARGLGALEYLRKPADLGALLEAFRKAAKRIEEAEEQDTSGGQ